MNNQKKKVRALYDDIRSQIISGILPSGVKLPSESELMEANDITRYSVRKALDMLESENLIQKLQGKGCFVCPQLPQKRESAAAQSTAPHSNQILLIASRAEHFYFLKSINGIEAALQDSGYSLTIKLSNYDAALEGKLLQEALRSDPYAGIMIFPSESAYLYTNLYLYRYIERNNIPCVLFGNKICSTNLPSVITDDYAGGCIAADHFLQKGHRSFVCIMNREEYSGCMRYAGFQEKMNAAEIPDENRHIIWFGHKEADSLFSSHSKEILSLAVKCTAFFCFNDAAAVNLYKLLTKNNIRVPDDVSIIGFDDTYLCELNPLPLTALHQDPEAAGYTAAVNLLRRIKDSTYDCNRIFLPYLKERQSVKDLN